MELIETKTYTIKLSAEELATLRCFLEDAIDKGVWSCYPEERNEIIKLYNMTVDTIEGINSH